jgi:geranylgeranyl diphosphate synthase type II
MNRREHAPVMLTIAHPPHAHAKFSAGPHEIVTVERIDTMRDAVDRRLATLSPESAALPQPLGSSIAYSLLASGKRLRPLLTILTAVQCGADETLALDIACAAEMVHVASLILDDLPCMDDATLRRGQPTNHLAFGEDTAILSAVSLLALAFRTVAEEDGIERDARILLVSTLSKAIGPGGLVAGQVSDLRQSAPQASISDIRQTNFRKTAALFCACGEAGVIIAGGREQDRANACGFAENVGLAFQILDDLKDAILTSLQVGKDVRKDGAKPTVVSALGRAKAQAELNAHIERARLHAAAIGIRTDPLLAFLESCFPEPLIEQITAGRA